MFSKKSAAQTVAFLALAAGLFAASAFTSQVRSENPIRDRLRNRFGKNERADGSVMRCEIAGLDCAVWAPSDTRQAVPLIVFSHGFHGSNMQSAFLMRALANAGYIVVAPNHHDAATIGGWLSKPQTSFAKAAQWSDQTYVDRKKDIVDLLTSLQQDQAWTKRIDWNKIALAGHSLGGYTVLGLSGAWPSWRLPTVKAVLALSPYCWPYSLNGNLGGIGVPVMYQGGTDDKGITPFVKGPNGAFEKTSSPAYFVYFNKFNHFSWTDLNRNEEQRNLVDHYSIAFFDKYLKGSTSAKPEIKEPGVVSLELK
ncbi:MAG TPA: alpha/beta fold hydrolase [Oculatellaceae cyanobacterium]